MAEPCSFLLRPSEGKVADVTAARHFFYLDRGLIREMLAPIEGGVYDEISKSQREERDRSAEARVGWGSLSVSGRRGKKREDQQAVVMKQTAESEFERLYSQLQKAKSIKKLAKVDERIWDQLKVGKVLEVRGSVPRRAQLIGAIRRITRKTADASQSDGATDLVVLLGGAEEYGLFGAVTEDNFFGSIKSRHLLHRRYDVWEWPDKLNVLGQIRSELEPGKDWLTTAYPYWERGLESLIHHFLGGTGLNVSYREISVMAVYQQGD